MSQREESGRGDLLRAAAGIALIALGATGLLWLVLDDHLPNRTLNSANLTFWAIVRPGAAVALGAGTWLLAVAVVNRRRRRDQGRPGQEV